MEQPYYIDATRESNAANADLLRQCPHCKRYHIVRNRSRDFCSDWCADTFYNRFVRGRKKGASFGSLQLPGTQVLEIDPTAMQAIGAGISNAQINKPENQQILDNLQIDATNGTSYQWSDLISKGFDLSKYSVRSKLHNTPEGTEAYCLSFGNYWLFCINSESVLIFKQKKHELRRII